MNVLSGADNVLYNLDRNRQDLSSITSKLSSGLRIQSASDDPSGLAISSNLQTRVGGLQQAVENVQTGGNLLTVADGVAANIQQMLQRINSLVIESNSDINSDEQLSAIQTEINQLLLEVNRMSSSANFNGLKLFDGSHDTYVAAPNQNVIAFEVNPGLLPDGTVPTSDSVSNSQAAASGVPGANGQLIQDTGVNGSPTNVYVQEQPQDPYVTGLFIMQITGASNNPVEPGNGLPIGTPGVYLRQIIYSPDSSFDSGKANEADWINAQPTNSNFLTGVSEAIPNSAQAITFNLPNLSANDVGVAMGVEILLPRASGGGTAISINDGGQEGSTISISLPTLSTSALQISNISVLRPTMVNANTADPNFGQSEGVDSSNQYAAMDAQIRVENALEQISSLRAQIGSQIVSTQEDSSNDNVNIVNLTASESSIRDLNVGAATTQFTKDQILNQVGMSVLSQYQVDARQLASLMINALVA